MRQFLIAATMIAATAPSAAEAVIFVRYEAFATGTKTTFRDYNPVPIVEEVSGRFAGTVDASDLAVGQSKQFAIGPNSNAGVSYGTITRTGFDQWGNAAFAGTDFLFAQDTPFPGGGTGQRQRAATFTVLQVFPAPVPEPTTWAMMVLGFDAAGYALRRRTLRFRLA